MIKYIIPEESSRSIIKFDTDTLKPALLYANVTYIDWMWIADEDGEYEGKPIKKGNIIIRFCNNYGAEKAFTIVLDAPELTDIYNRIEEDRKNYNAKYEQEKLCCACCNDAC